VSPVDLRVLIVAENVGSHGGESSLPLQYFRIMRSRGIEAWLVTHARCRAALEAALPHEMQRMHFVPDALVQKVLWQIGKLLPMSMSRFTTGTLTHLITQSMQRRIVRQLVLRHSVDIIHEPVPVSPREPSAMFGVGAPVVIGPLNGNMAYPPAFRQMDGMLVRGFVRVGRLLSRLANHLLPGKFLAARLLVANERTRQALPKRLASRAEELVENGVDLRVWQPESLEERNRRGPVKFVYSGRLIRLKCVDLLLEAFTPVAEKTECLLEIVGDGPERSRLESLASTLGLAGRVAFSGWLTPGECARALRRADVFVFPSLHDCGGAAVLEAMATGLPVIAANWGGPADYVDSTCGVLVEPSSREDFVAGLSTAMVRLAQSRELRNSMGEAAIERVGRFFTWDAKVDRMLSIYRDAIARTRAGAEHKPGVSVKQHP